MIKTKGYAAKTVKAPLTPYSFERRDPREHDVAIDIKYCGICHSDIHQARDEWGGSVFPMVPGHEIAGTVSHVGSKVTKFKVGDKVGFIQLPQKVKPAEKPAQVKLPPRPVEPRRMDFNKRGDIRGLRGAPVAPSGPSVPGTKFPPSAGSNPASH